MRQFIKLLSISLTISSAFMTNAMEEEIELFQQLPVQRKIDRDPIASDVIKESIARLEKLSNDQYGKCCIYDGKTPVGTLLEKDNTIVFSFRGTDNTEELTQSLRRTKVACASIFPRIFQEGKMFGGYLESFYSIRESLKKILPSMERKKIIVEGFSRGGSIATLLTLDFYGEMEGKVDITLLTYGAPGIFNEAAKKYYEKCMYSIQILHFMAIEDTVGQYVGKTLGLSLFGTQIRFSAAQQYSPSYREGAQSKVLLSIPLNPLKAHSILTYSYYIFNGYDTLLLTPRERTSFETLPPFESLLPKGRGILNSLQSEIQEAYELGQINAQQVTQIAQTRFREQKSLWDQLKKPSQSPFNMLTQSIPLEANAPFVGLLSETQDILRSLKPAIQEAYELKQISAQQVTQIAQASFRQQQIVWDQLIAKLIH